MTGPNKLTSLKQALTALCAENAALRQQLAHYFVSAERPEQSLVRTAKQLAHASQSLF